MHAPCAAGAGARLRRRDRQGQGGKLIAAARRWARGGAAAGDDEADDDARRFGLPDAAIAAIRNRLDAAAEEIEVWAENAAAVEAFLAVASQWRTAGGAMGPPLFVGLDYAAAIAGIRAAGITLTSEIWAGVRLMEGAARDALNHRR